MKLDPSRVAEVDAKHERVRALLQRAELDGLLLLSSGYIGWMTAGGDAPGWMPPAEPTLALLVTRQDRFILIAPDGSDASLRLSALPLGLQYQPALPQAVSFVIRAGRLGPGSRVGADVPLGDTRHVAEELVEASSVLMPSEQERLRELGQDLAVAMTHACLHARPGTRGHQVAALAAECVNGMAITGVRVAAAAFAADQPDGDRYGMDARIRTGFRLEICGRRGGLHAALARTVTFARLDPADYGEHVRGRRWVGLLSTGTAPGLPWTSPVSRSWAVLGAEPPLEGSSFLPVGGPGGYRYSHFAHREHVARPIAAGEAVAWRAPGWVSGDADTFLVTDGGVECMTSTPDLPTAQVVVDETSILRPGLVER